MLKKIIFLIILIILFVSNVNHVNSEINIDYSKLRLVDLGTFNEYRYKNSWWIS